MSIDVKLFNGCNHIIDGIKYQPDQCPKCNGKNFYYDMHFDISGKVVTCSSSVKLQQEVLKIMNDKKFGNKFHTQWGDMLINVVDSKFIGKKNLPSTSQKIQMIVYQTLQYLKKVQINNQIIFKNMSEEEIIKEIIDINVIPINNIGYNVSVTFSDCSGNIYTQHIQI